jgi:hypothetical protein
VDPTQYDAILMGYALCGNGLAGLVARHLPLVLPRAHDCIALLMGSRHRYQEYFDSNPGVYFRSTGWLERGQNLVPLARAKVGVGNTLEEFIEKYGEDDGQFLFEELNRYQTHYQKLTYIETGLEPDSSFEERARQEAARKGWAFEKLEGSLTLFQKLVRGDWDPADFLYVEAGQQVAVRYDDSVIAAEGCQSC